MANYPEIFSGALYRTNISQLASYGAVKGTPAKYRSDKAGKRMHSPDHLEVGMGKVHRLLEEHGKQGTLALDLDRRVIEAAADYMADEEGGVGFIYSGFAQAALPHRRLANDVTWQVETEHVLLMVEPGKRPIRGGNPEYIGVPYGSRARLILLYLMTRAIETGSREVELGKSMRSWLDRMGIPQGGPSGKIVRDQAERLSRCRLSFQVSQGGKTGLINQNIVDSALFLDEDGPPAIGRGVAHVLDKVRLGESFFEQLKKHPIPLEESAIRALQGHSMALDIYCWLAYRLHVLPRAREVSWSALKGQFGSGIRRLDHFRPIFLQNLELALAVYPAAQVEAGDRGVTLLPSRSPVTSKVHVLNRPIESR
jgi:Plasmid encoded RepA protein